MPAPFAGAIEQLFRVTPTDAAALARDLFGRSRAAYEKAVNAQLAAHGVEGHFALTNKSELARLRRQATETARGIAATYNADLAGKVDAVLEAEGGRGLNRRTLARRLADWDAERTRWKAPQIQATEGRRVAVQATQAFVEHSRLEDVARFQIVPAGSSHDDANDRAANSGELLRAGDPALEELPAHPHERHSAVLALPEGATIEAPWLGG